MSSKYLNNTEEVKKEYKVMEFLKKLYPYYLKYKFQAILVIVSLGLFTFSGRILPIIFGKAIDDGLQTGNIEKLHYFAITYLIFELSRSLFYFLQFYLSQKLSNRVLFDIRTKLVKHVQKLPIQYFDKTPVGKILTRMTNDVNGLGDFLTQGFTGILVNIIEIVAIFISLAILSFKLSLVTVFFTPIVVIVSIFLSKKIRFFSRAAKGKMSNINTHTSESLNGMKIINLYNHKDRTFTKFSKLTDEYFNLNYSLIKVFALLWPCLHLFNIAITATTLAVGAYFFTSFNLTVGTLSAYVLLLRSFFRPLRGILERYSQFQNSLASADRLFELLAVEQEDQTGGKTKPTFTGDIKFNNLSFKYDKDLPLVLKNINLDIKNKQSLAIVGRTGSGKSTLVSLIQKFYPVANDSLLVNGLCINKYQSHALRSKINVLQQNNFIFKGSLEDNVTLLNPNISHDTVINAIKTVQCDYLLDRQKASKNPKLFIEENGSNLSVGEKQLIAFARIIAFNPEILVLDEATANIDTNTEKLIQAATEKIISGRTSIIIAHRLSTIVNCDKILLLDQGEVLEYGSHKELLALNSHYHKLYNQQIKSSLIDLHV